MLGRQDVSPCRVGENWPVFMCQLASCVVAGTFQLCMSTMQTVLLCWVCVFIDVQLEAKLFYVSFLWFVDSH